MAVYIIIYDLSKETKPKITDVIEKNYEWKRLSESAHAVETEEPSDQVFSRLKSLLDASNENLYVITLDRPHEGLGPKHVIDWLEAKLEW
jgi:hypothetical protein